MGVDYILLREEKEFFGTEPHYGVKYADSSGTFYHYGWIPCRLFEDAAQLQAEQENALVEHLRSEVIVAA